MKRVEGKSLYDMVKDIVEDKTRLYAALSKNPKMTKVSDVFNIYSWISLYGIPSKEKKDEFRKELITFVKSVSRDDLAKDTDVLKALFGRKDRELLRFFYEKLGKDTFGTMVNKAVTESIFPGSTKIEFLLFMPLSEEEEKDFMGYWYSLIIDSNFNYFLEQLATSTDNYSWFFRGAPLEFGQSIKNLLGKCIEKKCDMSPALRTAIANGHYDIALFLIEKVPALIDTLKEDNNALVEGIASFIDNSLGSIPTQKQVEVDLKLLNGVIPKILKARSDLVAVFKPLKDVKTASAVSIKKAQEDFYKAYPYVDSGEDTAVVFVNIDLKNLLTGVQWREDVKDIIALLRQKALEKNIKINLSKYTDEQIKDAGFKDVFDGSYKSKHSLLSGRWES